MAEAIIDTAFERTLQKRYRQPEGVEQFGIEAIPAAKKTVKWYDLFSIILNFLVNPATILRGGLGVAAGLSFQASLAAECCGIIIAACFYVVIATVGVDYGIPGQVATRGIYGLRGSKLIPSFLRSIASCYWFAFQTVIGATAIVAVLTKLTGGSYPLIWVSVGFGLLQAFVAVVGYESLKTLSRIALPLKVVIFAYMFVLLANHSDPNFAPSAVLAFPGKAGWNWVIFATWLNASAAGWLTMITDAADFCRYSRTRADMWVGTLSAAAIGAFVSGALGAYAAAAVLGKTANPFVIITGISTGWLTPALLLVFVAIDNWTINVLNLYTGGLSISNIFERIGRFWTTLIASIAGVVLSAVPDVLNSYLNYVSMLGNFFSPIAGVLVFDYLLLKRMQLDVPSLFRLDGRYRYWRGFNLVAVAWTALGFLFYMFVVPTSWIPALATLLFTGIGYSVTALVAAARSQPMAIASAPVAAPISLPMPAE
ncbi:MAG: cytosine permease [Alphaproteobacteria bacterium]|nr:cytosine permease [Alphaproteobacteria bacterium]